MPSFRFVMSLHKLTAGDGYTYLTRQVAAHDTTERGYGGLGDYYSQKGEAPGQWMGRGVALLPGFTDNRDVTEAQMVALFGEGRHPDAARIERELIAAGHGQPVAFAATRLGSPFRIYKQVPSFRKTVAMRFEEWNTAAGLPRDWPVPADIRAGIRTQVATGMFIADFGRPPADARELSGFVARASRQATTAVAGYDLTFSPVKSVSALWAVGSRDIVAKIEAAHHSAVADTLGWLEDHATYTRTGRGAVAQVDVQGLLAAAFTHRDSRAGDPDLHTHVAISNKVQTTDGRWLALDGRPLHKMAVAASERYNTRLEAHLIDSLGVRFAERPGGDPGKRPVREIVGIDENLARSWSARRAAINTRRAVLATAFHADHGRTPTVVEALRLAQQATLETRQAKHEPRSFTQQRATWRTQAINALGGERQLAAMIRRALAPEQPTAAVPFTFSAAWVTASAATVIEVVRAGRATWQETHVRAETERLCRTHNVPLAVLDYAVNAVVARALSPAVSVRLSGPDRFTEPAALRRLDGTSVYQGAGTQLYTCAAVIAAENYLLAVAKRYGRPVVESRVIDVALLEATANGVDLNPGQIQLIRELAASGACLQLALAPAGTGKTTAMRVLARAWTQNGGHVIGLAPSAAAAAVLGEEIGTHSDTVAKLNHHLRDITTGTAPAWVQQIGPHTLVIIDEAGMASTIELATAVEFITGRGGSVRLIGDDQQLAAIGAGGVLRDIADTIGAVTLSQVMRFRDPAEGAASLALRAGDPSALGFYIDHSRVHVGDTTTVTDHAYTAWAADRAAGVDAVMLAPTRDLVAALNMRARNDRISTSAAKAYGAGTSNGTKSRHGHGAGGGVGGSAGREVSLVDGTTASAGDTIITRANNRRLPISATDWVKNGDRWTITAVRADGALDVIHTSTKRRVTLPAGYVANHVALGYATTVHGAQGVTADTCHTVATGTESRQTMYVAMTRGRAANHLYVTTAGDGDEHAIITRQALLPPTAVDILTDILSRDGAQISATSSTRHLADPVARLHHATDQYAHALSTAATDVLGTGRLAAIDTAANQLVPGLTDHSAWPILRGHLALLAIAGNNPIARLADAVQMGGLSGAHDPAAVLDWRLDNTGQHSTTPGPLPWLPAIPAALATNPTWGQYLTARAELVEDLTHQVADLAAAWTPTTAPSWTLPFTDNPTLVEKLAIWRASTGTPDTDLAPTGPGQLAAAERRAQQHLNNLVHTALGDPNAAATRWAPTVNAVDPRITGDPYWPRLASQLAAIDRAGLNTHHLVTTAGGLAPLPDEMPAAALWWRISRHLAPATLNTSVEHSPTTLRPDWTPVLVDVLGADVAARVIADPAWPSLVAAVTDARRVGWTPAQSLATAHDLIAGGQGDEPVRGHELATAMTWRIVMLTEAQQPEADHATAFVNHPVATYASGATIVEHQYPAFNNDNKSLDTKVMPLGVEPVSHDGDIEDLTGPPNPEDAKWLASHVSRNDEQPQATNNANTGTEKTSVEYAEHEQSATEQAPIGDINSSNINRPILTGASEPLLLVPDPRTLPATGPTVSAGRIAELNRLASAFFTDHYLGSWAAGHLMLRLGTDLVADSRFAPGYAPAGWTALTDHLHRHGVTDNEMLAAGLATTTKTGRIIDRFRDRLIFPIQNDGDIRGFIGRRNPGHDDAGPKYLNTPDTVLFHKGHLLFGLTENAAALAMGATPVLVEGPIDAIAITLTGQRNFVGVAPLGTALTDRQADQLRPHIRNSEAGIIVATDADSAGHQAAVRAYWHLTSRGDNPRHLRMDAGLDPAELLQTRGPGALQRAIADAAPLARTLIDERIAANAERLDTAEGHVHTIRSLAHVIGALPPQHWQDHIDYINQRIPGAAHSSHLEVFDAGQQWSSDPTGQARARLTEPIPQSATTLAQQATTREHIDNPCERWENVVRRIAPTLTQGPDWPQLAAALDRADNAGYDIETNLPQLATARPLPDRSPAQALLYRLVNECEAAITPLDLRTHLADTTAAANRATTRLTRDTARPMPSDNRPTPANHSTAVPSARKPAPEPTPRRQPASGR